MELQRIPVRFRLRSDTLPLLQHQFAGLSLQIVSIDDAAVEGEIRLTHDERAELTRIVHDLDGVIVSAGVPE